jgi:hypothetical protein
MEISHKGLQRLLWIKFQLHRLRLVLVYASLLWGPIQTTRALPDRKSSAWENLQIFGMRRCSDFVDSQIVLEYGWWVKACRWFDFLLTAECFSILWLVFLYIYSRKAAHTVVKERLRVRNLLRFSDETNGTLFCLTVNTDYNIFSKKSLFS